MHLSCEITFVAIGINELGRPLVTTIAKGFTISALTIVNEAHGKLLRNMPLITNLLLVKVNDKLNPYFKMQ